MIIILGTYDEIDQKVHEVKGIMRLGEHVHNTYLGESKSVDSYFETEDYIKYIIQYLNWDERLLINLLNFFPYESIINL